ncbi:nitrilase-related carbon-nitrogen hydrolase [Modestobacter sp. VKM Ac-2978]|uniref:nitrilase-related carbon-nitrogen hydrolase n=1 Tax=Modestobacter sp. VKM Ac-2978 TaxID=3004132 RepID=UPI0022AA59DF|nr:nitrilase-related carbon-nitrogen hydrolase [Modestobacter sp. VKM Ac-2978]MCZ2849839.1 N-carbamoylputrescine amidase [Modestobacter sp. VKM Ac-2978]
MLLLELFAGPYFCQERDPAHFELARTIDQSPVVARMESLVRELGVVLPVSFYARTADGLFNSVAVIDADGRRLGVYRKSHVPDDPGYVETSYFADGDTGFRVDTAVGRVGVGICWDQWFPEAARVMTLLGAQLLVHPTAIGSDPLYPGGSPMAQWQRCMQGHAAANSVPVLASNRVGTERTGSGRSLDFLGRSLVADHHGEILTRADEHSEVVLLAEVDLAQADAERQMWGLFRDRRPELYGRLTTG